MSGTATTNLPLSDSADDVIGNAAGSTIRVSMARLAALLGTLQGPAYGSVTQLQADTAWPAGAIGSVYGGTAAQIGVYRKSGAPGSGSWSRIGDLPVSSITAAQLSEKAALADLTAEIAYRRAAIRDAGIMPLANVTGRNSITATLTPSMIEGGATLANTSTVELIPAETSDGPVQLSLDGATPVPVRDAAGAELQVGALLAGRSYFLRRRGSTWRIIAGGISSVEMRAEAQARTNATRDTGVLPLTNIAGTANAITAEISPTVGVTLSALSTVELIPVAANTGATTLHVSGAVAWPIQRRNGSALQAGDLKVGVSYLLRRRGSAWRLIGLVDSDVAGQIDAEKAERIRDQQRLLDDLGNMEGELSDPIRRVALLPAHRPGDTPWLHTPSLRDADPYSKVSLPITAVGIEGAAVRITGSGTVASRGFFAVEPGRTYRVRAAVRRIVNPVDPAGDAVRVGVAWYDRYRTLLPGVTTNLADITDLTTGSGRQERAALVSRAGPSGSVAAPAGGIYARPYVQTFGTNCETDVEVLDWQDVTDLSLWAPDVGDLVSRVLAVESLAAGARLSALEAEAGLPSSLRFVSRAAAAAASIPQHIDFLEVLGVGSYRRNPAGTALTTADGARWSPTAAARAAYPSLAAAVAENAGGTVTIAYDDQALPSDFEAVLLEYTAEASLRNYNQTAFTANKAKRLERVMVGPHPDRTVSGRHLEVLAEGSTKNGPWSATVGQTLYITKKGYSSGAAIAGEIDALSIFLRQDGPDGLPSADPGSSDAAVLMFNAQNIGTCGFVSLMDSTVSNLRRDPGFPIDISAQIQYGVIDANNAAGKVLFGYVAGMKVGIGRTAYHVGVSPGSDWENYFDSPRFRIRGTGDLRWRDGDYPDYAAQIGRALGLDGQLSILNRGAGGISIASGGAGGISFATNNTARIAISAAGNLQPSTDMGANLGADARRWGAIHAQALIVYGNNITESGLPVYADNAAAKAGGLGDGRAYRTTDGTRKIVF